MNHDMSNCLGTASLRRVLTITSLVIAGAWMPSLLAAESVLDDDGRLVRFERDIAPILRDKCLECHGPEQAKNDFRVDELDSFLEYIEPEDASSSTLYMDYLVCSDEDMLMPPASKGGPLSTSELALIKTWIDEGALWPDGYTMVADEQAAALDTPEPDQAAEPATGLVDRLWAFQGYLHPAAVHFPIALLTIGGLFVILGWKWPAIGTQVPLACLWIGAPAALGTTLMGWSFAVEKGYGGWESLDTTKEVFWHRWSAVVITVLAMATACIALVAVRSGREHLTKFWKTGLLVSALLVGLVGHQGGELTYGETFYQQAFEHLFPPAAKPVVERTQSPPPQTIADATGDTSVR